MGVGLIGVMRWRNERGLLDGESLTCRLHCGGGAIVGTDDG